MAVLNSINRDISKAWEQFPPAETAARGKALYDLADLYDAAAVLLGNTRAAVDADTALLLRLLADAEWVATGQLTYRHSTASRWEPILGPTLDRIATTPNVRDRAQLVDELAFLVPGQTGVEVLAGMRFVPAPTLHGLLQALGSMWAGRGTV